MNEVPDYSGYTEQPAPGDDRINQLVNLAQQAQALELEIEEADEALKKKRDIYRTLIEFTIPGLMADLQLETFKTASGVPVAIKEKVRASIPKHRYPEAVEWLDENGLSGVVKRKFVIEFTKEEQAWAKKFEADLRRRKNALNCKREDKIEPATLTALVSRRLKAGEQVPMDLFGVFIQKFAQIGNTKE